MSRYVTLPKMRVDENGDADAAESLAKVVWEKDETPTDTGLVDKRGVPLYRTPDLRPFGFFAKWTK